EPRFPDQLGAQQRLGSLEPVPLRWLGRRAALRAGRAASSRGLDLAVCGRSSGAVFDGLLVEHKAHCLFVWQSFILVWCWFTDRYVGRGIGRYVFRNVVFEIHRNVSRNVSRDVNVASIAGFVSITLSCFRGMLRSGSIGRMFFSNHYHGLMKSSLPKH